MKKTLKQKLKIGALCLLTAGAGLVINNLYQKEKNFEDILRYLTHNELEKLPNGKKCINWGALTYLIHDDETSSPRGFHTIVSSGSGYIGTIGANKYQLNEMGKIIAHISEPNTVSLIENRR